SRSAPTPSAPRSRRHHRETRCASRCRRRTGYGRARRASTAPARRGARAGSRVAGLRRRLLAAPVPTLETIDTSAGVNELLLARVEGMALRAQLDVHVALGRPGRERVATGAANFRHDVLRMDI